MGMACDLLVPDQRLYRGRVLLPIVENLPAATYAGLRILVGLAVTI
jgi:hypothetical protein